MSAPLEYIVKQANDALGRMSEQKGLSWEGGAARVGLDAIRQLQGRVHELETLQAPKTQNLNSTGDLTNEQITSGAAALCDCETPNPIGRNTAIAVFDAMTTAK